MFNFFQPKGGKIYYKFTKSECLFDKSFNPMLKEVTRYYGIQDCLKTQKPIKPIIIEKKDMSVIDWSQKNVDEWIRTLNLTSWM